MEITMKKVRFDTKVQYIKYKVLSEVARFAYEGTLLENLNNIPKIISPGPKSDLRCCIYKERAIVSERIQLAIEGIHKGENVISVIGIACDECPADGYTVTNDCRSCLSHRCKRVCPKKAISFDSDMKAVIDKSKCVNCGLCAKACPFGAIQSRKRPCISACKANAIGSADDMSAKINDEKCIACGACVYQCPFGAISDRSSIVHIINALKDDDKHVYAMVAPAIASQFNYATVEQAVSGLKKLGFYSVVETALGADMVARDEAKELAQKGELTSSCCPAFVQYVKQEFPELADKISHNPSPMVALGRYLKSIDHRAVVVFIGPCTAKKREAAEESDGNVDYVMTFEELQAVFNGRDIDISELEGTPLDNASYFGRIFARAGGLTDAVTQSLKEQNIDFDARPIVCDGIENIKAALAQMKRGNTDFNFIEGMACLGGCIGGPCNIMHEARDKVKVEKFAKTAPEHSITASAENKKI